jgi:hypothetical protein
MFYRLGILLIISISISISAGAKGFSCHKVNHYDDPDSPLHEMDVCDQGPLGVCYATTAAQMINYELAGQVKGKASKTVSVHPLWIAYLYKKDDIGFSAGIASKSAHVVRRHGICPAPVIQQSIKDFVGSAWMNGYQLFCMIEKFQKNWTGEVNARVAYQKAHQSCMGWGTFNEDVYDNMVDLISDASGTMKKPNSYKMARQIFHSCYKPGVIQKKKIGRLDVECDDCTDKDVQKEISEGLVKGEMVGVDYCAEVLDDKNYEGIGKGRNSSWQFTPRGNKIKDAKKCGPHSSVLVGMKKINNKCHFLLRNSWGNRKYREWPNCVCEEYDGTVVDCQYGQAPYKAVSCWVGADELVKNTYRVLRF